MRVFYEGKNYHGYQRQPDVTTVEENIIVMLKKTNHIQNIEQSNFKSASRTDKFVSAIGNAFAFDSEKQIILDQINAKGPKDKSIVCWAYSEIEDSFSPKFSNWKRYWYILPSDYVKETYNLTLEELRNICSIFEGNHDFRLFCRLDHRATEREINRIEVFENNDIIIFEFVAQSFLWEQIRRIVSYVLSYNQLPEELQDTKFLLESNNQIKELNLPPADPRNLLLVEHFYENIKWIKNEKAIKSIVKELEIKFQDIKRDLLINSVLRKFFKTNY